MSQLHLCYKESNNKNKMTLVRQNALSVSEWKSLVKELKKEEERKK